MSRWAGRTGWILADQILFAFANFALNLALARWLTASDFGAYAIAYQLFLLLATIHDSALCEPMQVFALGRYRDRRSSYLNLIVKGHWGLSALLSAGLVIAAAACALAGSSALAIALLGLAAAGPLILLLWLLRRACHAFLSPRLSASAGALYTASMLGGAYLFYRSGSLGVGTVFLVIGASSAVAAFRLMTRLGLSLHLSRHPVAFVREAMAMHWRYGRWAIATGLLGMAPLSLYFVILPLWYGLEAAATLRALLILMLPLVHFSYGLNVLLLPAMTRWRGTRRYTPAVLTLAAAFAGLSLLYLAGLVALQDDLFRWLYGGRYADAAHLVWLVGAWQGLHTLAAVVAFAMRALERPDWAFWAQAAAFGLTCTIGAVAVLVAGVPGAAFGGIVSSLAGLLILLGFLLAAPEGVGPLRRPPGAAEPGSHAP